MELFDTHCHLDVGDFDADRQAVIARAHQANVRHILIPAITAKGWPRLLAVCTSTPGLYPALGLHPLFCAHHQDADLEQLHSAITQYRPAAIGEIGLDYYPKDADKRCQQYFFEAQINIAREHALPIILHVRKAHDVVLDILNNTRPPGGIAHAFNGSLEQASRYIDLGFKLGLGGMLTYDRSTKLHALARKLPLDAIVLETDAPDLVVASHAGERNSPEYLPQVLSTLATLRNVDVLEIASHTTANAFEVLGITPEQ